MKNLHIVGNWKMSLNKEDSLKLAHNIKLINNKDNLNIEVAPTSLYLAEIAEILQRVVGNSGLPSDLSDSQKVC